VSAEATSVLSNSKGVLSEATKGVRCVDECFPCGKKVARI